MHCRSVPLLRVAAEGLDSILQLQRFQAETYIMILGQLEALLQECCLLHHAASSRSLENGSSNVRSEVCDAGWCKLISSDPCQCHLEAQIQYGVCLRLSRYYRCVSNETKLSIGPYCFECCLSDALPAQVWEIQQSLVDSLSAAATVLVKAEQDTSGTSKDARPHCAARIALSKAVSAASLARA